FKPNTDDIREAPALVIIQRLLNAGAKVKVYDPEAMEAVKKYTSLDVTYADSMYAAAVEVDALLVITEWNEFRTPDLARLKTSMKAPLVFDGRNVYALKDMSDEGFVYYSVGRSAIGQTKNEADYA
ncbi:MAG: UDP binding domain-containing protein, partial [Bacteroidota bacterium]